MLEALSVLFVSILVTRKPSTLSSILWHLELGAKHHQDARSSVGLILRRGKLRSFGRSVTRVLHASMLGKDSEPSCRSILMIFLQSSWEVPCVWFRWLHSWNTGYEIVCRKYMPHSLYTVTTHTNNSHYWQYWKHMSFLPLLCVSIQNRISWSLEASITLFASSLSQIT